MHKTRLPLTLWFRAAHLVAMHGPGISALQLQRQLAISRYETAWTLLHKLRRAMVAPGQEPLTGAVEVEVSGNGSGRLRLQLLPDPSARSLTSFVRSRVAAGARGQESRGWLFGDRARVGEGEAALFRIDLGDVVDAD